MVTVSGAYIGSEVVTSNRDGKQETRTVVLVADGMEAIKVYCEGTPDLSDRMLGDPIEIQVRPYSKNGVGYYHGLIVM